MSQVQLNLFKVNKKTIIRDIIKVGKALIDRKRLVYDNLNTDSLFLLYSIDDFLYSEYNQLSTVYYKNEKLITYILKKYLEII